MPSVCDDDRFSSHVSLRTCSCVVFTLLCTSLNCYLHIREMTMTVVSSIITARRTAVHVLLVVSK